MMTPKRMSMIATGTTMMTGRIIIDLLLWRVLVGSGCEVCVGETQVDAVSLATVEKRN